MVTHSGPIVLWEELVDISFNEAGLSCAQLADHQNFEQVFLHFFEVLSVAVLLRVIRVLRQQQN